MSESPIDPVFLSTEAAKALELLAPRWREMKILPSLQCAILRTAIATLEQARASEDMEATIARVRDQIEKDIMTRFEKSRQQKEIKIPPIPPTKKH